MVFSYQALIQRFQSLQASGVTEVSGKCMREILEAVKKTVPAVPVPEKNAGNAAGNAEKKPPASGVGGGAVVFSLKVGERPGDMKKEEKKEVNVLPVLKPEVENLEPLFEMEDRHEALRLLAAKVARCTRCLELVANRTQTVLGVGNPYAELMFVGEAPGADEDKQGIPFVGRAGKLLTDMIEKGMKISRMERTYVCNILRCRPPGNRTPLPTEAERCRPFLDAQIAIVRPKFICCLGASAAQNLLSTTTSISRMRGQVYQYRGVSVVCTYHPAYLLRNPSQKAAAWEDLQFLMKLMGIPRE